MPHHLPYRFGGRQCRLGFCLPDFKPCIANLYRVDVEVIEVSLKSDELGQQRGGASS